jgi:hypothetical protein
MPHAFSGNPGPTGKSNKCLIFLADNSGIIFALISISNKNTGQIDMNQVLHSKN